MGMTGYWFQIQDKRIIEASFSDARLSFIVFKALKPLKRNGTGRLKRFLPNPGLSVGTEIK